MNRGGVKSYPAAAPMEEKELPAVLILRHHAELAHALTWHLSVPGYFTGFGGGAVRFFFRAFSTGIESNNGKGDGEADQFHGVDYANEFVERGREISCRMVWRA